MRDKQQLVRLAGVCLNKSEIVEGRDHSFSCSGCGDNKIPVMSPDLPFRLELVQNLLLKGIRANIEHIRTRLFPLRFLETERLLELLAALRLIGFELAGFPVAVEGRADFPDHFRLILLRRLHIPLEAGGHRRA